MNHNLPSDSLLEIALKNGEGTIVKNGALVERTVKRTGRTPADKFIVIDDKTRDVVNWGQDNQPIDSQIFEKLWDESEEYLKDKTVFTSDLHVGASEEHYQPVRVENELAWHNMFCQSLFIRPSSFKPFNNHTWHLRCAPNFVCDPKRHGTNSDGTIKRTNALSSGAIDSNPLTHEHFSNNQRDVTLTRAPLEINYLSRVRRIIPGPNANHNVRQGHAYAGPRYAFLDKNIQTIFNGAGFTFQTFHDIKIIGTRTGLDGQPAIFIATSHPDGRNLKTNFTIPATIATNKNDFSNTITNFSQTTATFDDTTP